MSTSPAVSLVIPAYGPSPFILELLGAVKAGTVQPSEIIVSHSASDDPTGMLREHYPEVKVLHAEGRLYAGAARNRGVQEAQSELIALCDSDVLPASDWLEKLLAALNARPERFVVGSVGAARSGGYWGMSTWLCEFSEMLPWRKPQAQAGGASCNMAVRKTDFLRVGKFDESMTPGEDTILFYRLREAGLEQWFAPEANVGHFNRPGFRAFLKHQFSLGLHSAKVRRSLPLKGAAAVRYPILMLGLWLPKTCLIVRRTLSEGIRGWGRVALFLPSILLGSWIWTAGCLKEAFSSSCGPTGRTVE